MGRSPFRALVPLVRLSLPFALVAAPLGARSGVVAVGPHARASAQALPTWRVVGDAPVSAGGVFCTQVAVAPDGVPHLAYQDFTAAAHRLTVQRFAGGAWQPLTPPGTGSAGDAWYDRMAFDANGALLVATRDYGLQGRLGVRRCAGPGAGWELLGGPGSVSDAHYTDVALLPGGEAVAVFQDAATVPAYGTTVQMLGPGGWQRVGQDGLALGYSAYQSLAVTPDGDLYVAFTDSGRGDKAVVMRYDRTPGLWAPVGTAGFTPEIANNLILRVAPDGTPYVAYYVWNSRVVVRRWNGSAWAQVGNNVNVPDLPTVETEGWRQWLALQIDAQGRPWVAFQAANLGRRAVVKRWDAAAIQWEVVGDEGFTPGAADYLSFALAPDGTPYVAFRDGVTQRALVMAWR